MDERTRARLIAVLAAYGADPARWPAADREQLEPLLTRAEPDVAEIVRDARAIDVILMRASEPAPPPGATARLLSKAKVQQGAGRRSNVVQLSRAGRGQGAATHRSGIAAIAALAASFALGMYLGATGLADAFMPELLAGNGEVFSAELDMVDGTQQLFGAELEL